MNQYFKLDIKNINSLGIVNSIRIFLKQTFNDEKHFWMLCSTNKLI